jgi:hypothetical protein
VTEQHDHGDVRERLEATLGPVVLSDLAAHLRRGAVFVVAPGRPLLECAMAIAIDDASTVKSWIDRGDLRRATDDDAEQWSASQGRTWIAVVVQPYVLVQDPPD